MRRGLWFVAGAGAGVYATACARRVAEAFTADGLRDRWQGLRAGARVLGEEAATARAERESQLREQLGLTPHGAVELDVAGRRDRLGLVRAGEQSPPTPHSEQEGSS
ncbi:MAG: DUF6167 family protein [Nocardioides sp.]